MKHDYWNEFKQLESAYDICRKKIMKRCRLSAIETDVLLFLANNPKYDTASMVSSVRRIPKSHVSLAVKLLHEKNYLQKEEDASNKKRVHLILTKQAEEIVQYGIRQQEAFAKALLKGFSQRELEQLTDFTKRISDNLYEYEQNILQEEN